MALIQFTKNHTDHSTDKGYQFEFFCDRCRNGFMSEFDPSVAGLAAGALRTAGSLFGGMFGQVGNSTYEIERAVRGPGHDKSFREAIEAARLDALIFADIGMHPTTYFLAMHRLAPVQVALWGHPETTGLDTIDYFFTAAGVETEGADSYYTERLVRPKSFFLGGFQRPARAMPLSREALGLPLQSTVYACLQPAFKIHPNMDAAFAGIFERDPKAHLLLLEGRPSWAHRLRQRFARSIPGHQHRMHWLPTLPHARFMATLACADVSLDPLYFGGGNSSCEALAQGIPLVTLPGTHAYGRLSLALCQEMNELRGIASSVDDYVDRAVDLANHAERHAMRQDVAERATVLFDRRDISLALGEFLASAVAAIA